MGWKSIQMQVALTRTVDIAKTQASEERHGQNMQQLASQKQMKQEELKRQQTNELEKQERLKNDQNPKDETNDQENNHSSEEQDPQDKKSVHPYLGSQIDISK